LEDRSHSHFSKDAGNLGLSVFNDWPQLSRNVASVQRHADDLTNVVKAAPSYVKMWTSERVGSNSGWS